MASRPCITAERKPGARFATGRWGGGDRVTTGWESGGVRGSVQAVQGNIAIIGAGFAGLLAGIQLKRAGISSFAIYERAERLGGTWRDNVYPGAACDVPAQLYSYSFEPKPDWSRKFAEQPEILAYIEHCARKYGVLAHVRCGVEISDAEYDESRACWQLRSAAGEQIEAQVVISAVGQLSRPAYPRIAGLDRFAGPAFHSARWRSDVPLSGRRVAVIGTGASAIQFVPPVAEVAGRLLIFQRSPPWIMPKPDRAYGRWEQQIYKWLPLAQSLLRKGLFAYFELGHGGLRRGSVMNRVAQWLCERNLRQSVTDERLRKVLLPDYPAGCKRILISNDYYRAVQQPHVSVLTSPIAEVCPDGLRTEDGVLHEADVIIYGTGFAASDLLAPLRIRGRQGAELRACLQRGSGAYLGICVSRFPNFFMLYGPNTNLGHNSILYMLEAQVRYVLSAISVLRSGAARFVDVKPEPMQRFRAELAERLGESIWAAGCSSWYQTEAGVQTNNWPGPALEYERRTRQINLADFETG